MKETIVISAFPACGKSWCYNNLQDKYLMLDSDSSEFSWIKDENGNNTKERNPKFPNNYIKHIKENLGKVDFIFVSSHEVVRMALIKNNINFSMIYPAPHMKNEWVRRFKERGNNEGFIDFISSNWDDFMDNIMDWSDSYENDVQLPQNDIYYLNDILLECIKTSNTIKNL